MKYVIAAHNPKLRDHACSTIKIKLREQPSIPGTTSESRLFAAVSGMGLDTQFERILDTLTLNAVHYEYIHVY